MQNEKFTPPTDEIKKEYGVTVDPAAHGSNGFIHSTYSPFFWPTTSKSLCKLRLGLRLLYFGILGLKAALDHVLFKLNSSTIPYSFCELTTFFRELRAGRWRTRYQCRSRSS